jgi:galactose mutarotase-like enzyme
MWDANPEIWGSYSPVLFPIIGALKNNECTIAKKKYVIPKHGFVRYNEDIRLENRSHDRLNFQLDYSDKTLAQYPYKFKFNITFQLVGNKLVVTHKVKNLDSKSIFFALGAHPGFKCPINAGEEYEDYFIEFEKQEQAEVTLLSDSGLITDNTRLVLDDTNILPLRKDLFVNDALIFKDLKSRKVSLKSNKSEQVLTMRFADFEYLGIWAKPNAPFVCIEPWLGITDHEDTDGNFLEKDGLIKLPVGELYSAQYSIEIEE